MTRARRDQVSLETTPFYHCVCRCVRRAFLCVHDKHSGRCFEHRRQWIIDRLGLLTEVFAIDIAAYAVMSNHYHILVKIDAEKSEAWSADEVIERWCRIFNGCLLVDRYRTGDPITQAERDAVDGLVELWRSRLTNLGWFMRCLNETIARQANAEDDCKGRFWEGRYKSQALLDEAAVIACMTYIDLNPIRAGMAQTPETSKYTSLHERIHDILDQSASLLPFLGNETQGSTNGIPIAWSDYLALVDWTGRAIRDDKHGAIPAYLTPIFVRLGINESEWVDQIQHFGHRYYRVFGALARIRAFAKSLGQRWMQGQTCCQRFYRPRPA